MDVDREMTAALLSAAAAAANGPISKLKRKRPSDHSLWHMEKRKVLLLDSQCGTAIEKMYQSNVRDNNWNISVSDNFVLDILPTTKSIQLNELI